MKNIRLFQLSSLMSELGGLQQIHFLACRKPTSPATLQQSSTARHFLAALERILPQRQNEGLSQDSRLVLLF